MPQLATQVPEELSPTQPSPRPSAILWGCACPAHRSWEFQISQSPVSAQGPVAHFSVPAAVVPPSPAQSPGSTLWECTLARFTGPGGVESHPVHLKAQVRCTLANYMCPRGAMSCPAQHKDPVPYLWGIPQPRFQALPTLVQSSNAIL